MTERLLSHIKRQPIALLALFVALGGSSYAAVSSGAQSDEVIHACVGENSGRLRVVESPKRCGSLETPLSFNREGREGDRGKTGERGRAGAKGDDGTRGTAGAKGDAGAAGPKGDGGAKGAAGAKGDAGSAGATGAKGDTGNAGAAGAKGDTGNAGAAGAAGAKGDKGDSGDAGTSGAAGAKGDKGDTGDAGTAGAAGAKGDTGNAGAAGAKGDTGNAGTAGADGQSVTGATESAGVNCPSGGVRYTAANGAKYVCNGTPDSAADVLTKVKTVDGPGSDLDADTLDGTTAADFLRADAFSGSFNSAFPSAFSTYFSASFGSAFTSHLNSSFPNAFDSRLSDLFGTDNSTSANSLGRANDCMMAEIHLTAATFAPPGTMFAAGQTLAISQWSALFSLIGTTYGGDGMTTFRVPDLRKQAPGGTHYAICHSGTFPSRS